VGKDSKYPRIHADFLQTGLRRGEKGKEEVFGSSGYFIGNQPLGVSHLTLFTLGLEES